jgi:DNA-binding MarR family transcriptional regulator
VSASNSPASEDGPPSVSPHGLDDDLGWAIGVLSRSYRREAMGAVQNLPGGARGYHVLEAIAVGEPTSQLDLARRLGINKSVMTYLVDELEEAGMVLRRPDPADRRARQVLITPVGKRALVVAREQVSIAEARLLQDLSSDEAQTLRALMRRLASTVPVPGDDTSTDMPPNCA